MSVPLGAWYDLSPARYAEGLRYAAERSDEVAVRQAAMGTPRSAGDAERSRRQARRLRAMALLCDRSSAARAGDVDFLGMSDPSQSRDDEDRAVAIAECMR